MTQPKHQLRATARARRAALSKPLRRSHSASICSHLTESAPWREAKTVAIYASFRAEVDTDELLRRAIRDGKQLLLPKVVAPKMPLAFFEVRPDSSDAWPLTEGAFGVQEPNDSCAEVPLDHIDLLIVPALALDTTGARLGWGGGFYDRTLERCSGAKVLAVVFDCQIVESVPVSEHDLPVDGWVSESGLCFTARGSE